MEIIIRIETTESTAKPPSVQTYAEPAVAPATSAVEQVRPTDAVNAGPAPTSPEQTGGPPVHVVASKDLQTETDSALSAGAAPDIP
jgi:hypothetical protein